MIKICALLFLMACVFAVDCYMQYKNIVSIHKSSSKLSTYAAVTIK
jgi:hypothetical protein